MKIILRDGCTPNADGEIDVPSGLSVLIKTNDGDYHIAEEQEGTLAIYVAGDKWIIVRPQAPGEIRIESW